MMLIRKWGTTLLPEWEHFFSCPYRTGRSQKLLVKCNIMALQLDPDQQQCVDSSARHLLVVAGPGSGKTTMMAGKCASLLQKGVAPESIIVLTFTNKAANELRTRIKTNGSSGAGQIRCGTYHGVALQLLRDYRVPPFHDEVTLLTHNQHALDVFKKFLHKANPSWKHHAALLSTLYHDGRCKLKTNVIVRAVKEKPSGLTLIPASVVKEAFLAYEAFKRSHHLVDYDDLLHGWFDFLDSGTPEAAAELARTQYVVCDEVQDTNEIQNEIARVYASHGASVTAVGDDCQSIYRFRGSDMRHIHTFVQSTPGAEQLALERNYRSSPEICLICERIIEYNYTRIPKAITSMCESGPMPSLYAFTSVAEEHAFIAGVFDTALAAGMECAALFRTNKEVEAFETVLKRKRLPYAMLKGSAAFESVHVKHLLLLYQFVFQSDPARDVIENVFKMHRGVSADGASELANKLYTNEDADSIVLAFTTLLDADVPMYMRPLHSVLKTMVPALQKLADKEEGVYGSLGSQLASICMQHLMLVSDVSDEEQHQLRQIDDLRDTYTSFDTFMDAVALGATAFEVVSPSTMLLVIGTIHQAKGLEFDSVIVSGCVDGTLPSFQSTSLEDTEEERRLLYVAASRAKTQLCFTFSVYAATDKDQSKERRLSQFLRPLIPNLAVKKGHQFVPAPPTLPTSTDLEGALSQLLRFYGKMNLLNALCKATLQFQPFDAGLDPCPLFRKSPTPVLSNQYLGATATNAALFARIVLELVRDNEKSWEEALTLELRKLFMPTGLDYSRRQSLLTGNMADGTISTSAWPTFMAGLQNLVDRLMAASPQHIVINKKILTPDESLWCRVHLLLDNSLFLFVYDALEFVTAEMSLFLLMQAAILRQKAERYCVTTVVVVNLYTGMVFRSPLPQQFDKSRLPLQFLTEPLVALL